MSANHIWLLPGFKVVIAMPEYNKRAAAAAAAAAAEKEAAEKEAEALKEEEAEAARKESEGVEAAAAEVYTITAALQCIEVHQQQSSARVPVRAALLWKCGQSACLHSVILIIK